MMVLVIKVQSSCIGFGVELEVTIPSPGWPSSLDGPIEIALCFKNGGIDILNPPQYVHPNFANIVRARQSK